MKQTTLIIEDEVNVHFKNLDVSTRNKVYKELEYFVPYARHLPSYKLGRWNGMVSFATRGGRTSLNLLDRVLPVIEQAGYEINIDDRRHTIDLSFPKVTADMFSHIKWPEGHPAAGEPVILRDYQVVAINAYLENPQCLQEIATGAGKTLITTCLSKITEPLGRSIVIVPNRDLVTQTEADYKNLGLDVGVFYGGRKEYNKTHTICTWQSLNFLDKQTKDKKKDGLVLSDEEIHDFINGVSTIIVDECFDGDTLILTPGGEIKIANIKCGDTIVSYNEKTNVFEEDTVIDVYQNMIKSQDEKMFELVFDNDTIVKVTGNHKFLTNNRGWVRADELTKFDDIIHI